MNYVMCNLFCAVGVNSKVKFVDLFCGIGGFRQALIGDTSNCVMSSDCDRHAQTCLPSKLWGDSNRRHYKFPSADVPKHDILCGGFPVSPSVFLAISMDLKIYEALCSMKF